MARSSDSWWKGRGELAPASVVAQLFDLTHYALLVGALVDSSRLSRALTGERLVNILLKLGFDQRLIGNHLVVSH